MLLYVNQTYSQLGKIKIYMKDFCKDSVSIYNHITIKDSKDSIFIYNFNNSKGLDEGEYRLMILEIGEIIVKLKKNEDYIDTLYVQRVNELYGVTSAGGYYGFYYCDELCQGKITDYYKTNVKRLEGTFHDGLPTRQLRKYYPNGNIMEIREYSKFKRLRTITHFDEIGNQTNIEKKGHKVKIIRPSAHNKG
jgi:hypothetical protein